MKNKLLRIVSLFIIFTFSFYAIIPPSFAELPCWNDATISYANGGVIGVSRGGVGVIDPAGSTKVADPVNLANGNYFYEHQDLFIPSRGLSLEMKRLYNSLDKYEGPFGIGWSHNYNIYLVDMFDGSKIYTLRCNADGTKDIFVKKSDGSYEPLSPGCYDTFSKNAEGYVAKTKHGLSYNFDLNGRLKSILDRNQNKIILEYDSKGLLTKVSDVLGHSLFFTYNANNKIISITDSSDRTTTYKYDSLGDLISVTTPQTEDYPSGLTTTYTYNSQHKLLSITDAKGNTYVSLSYDSYDRVGEMTYGGHKYTFTYGADSTTLIDHKGYKTVYYINPDGTTAKKVQYTAALRLNDPSFYGITYEYNQDKEITKIIYPSGNSVLYGYDSKGNVILITRKPAEGSTEAAIVTAFTYEPNFNQIKTLTDPRGNTTTYTYDYELDLQDPSYGTNGNLVKITYPSVGSETIQTKFTYNSYGQVKTATDPNGIVALYEYYPETGYLQKIINAYNTVNQVETIMTYESVGNVISIKDMRGYTTTFTYNALNQLIKTTSPAPFNYVTKYQYDENGNLKKVERQSDDTGTTWQATVYTYDILDRLKTITDNLNNVTTFDYDANGNRSSIQDANANTTTYQYDERSILWKVIDALGNVTEYAYDNNENLKEIKDANGSTTAYTYDDFDRLIKTVYPDSSYEEYTYDANSNLITKKDPKGQTIYYDYDALNRLIEKGLSPKGTVPESVVTYTYDVGSRLISSLRGEAEAISYTYDNLNRVTQVTYPGAKSVSYEYDSNSNRTKLTYPDSTYITYTYDELNRLTSVIASDSEAISTYSYDSLSRRTTASYLNGTSASYTYDDINRLTDLTNNYNPTPNTYTYTYDNAGNRLSKADNTGTESYIYDNIYQVTNVTYPDTTSTTYNYDALGNRTSTVNGGTINYTSNNLNQYTSVGTTNYTYDLNGNLTSNVSYTYSYDYENRLISATDGVTTAAYTYDAFGRRTTKTVDGVTTKFLYDGDQVIAEYDGTGTLLRKFIYGSGIDEPILMDDGTSKYFYHFDGLGSVTTLTDSSGAVVESYSYDIYGLPNTTSSIGNPYLFTGRRYDDETGLYYYRARYYSPGLGRFLQRDPFTFAENLNLYLYCANNPVNFRDPSGLFWEELNLAVRGYGWKTHQEVVDETAAQFDTTNASSITYKADLVEEGVTYPTWGGKSRIEIGPSSFDFWNKGWLSSTIGHELQHANDIAINFSGTRAEFEVRAYGWELKHLHETGLDKWYRFLSKNELIKRYKDWYSGLSKEQKEKYPAPSTLRKGEKKK